MGKIKVRVCYRNSLCIYRVLDNYNLDKWVEQLQIIYILNLTTNGTAQT